MDRLTLNVDIRGASLAVPTDREGETDVSIGFECRQLRLAVRAQRLLRAKLTFLLTNDRVGRADDLGLRNVAVENEPLENPAKFGVAFFVTAQVGRKVIERPHRPANIR